MTQMRDYIGHLEAENDRLRAEIEGLREALQATVDLLRNTNPNQPLNLAAIAQTIYVLEDALAEGVK